MLGKRIAPQGPGVSNGLTHVEGHRRELQDWCITKGYPCDESVPGNYPCCPPHVCIVNWWPWGNNYCDTLVPI